MSSNRNISMREIFSKPLTFTNEIYCHKANAQRVSRPNVLQTKKAQKRLTKITNGKVQLLLRKSHHRSQWLTHLIHRHICKGLSSQKILRKT